MKIEDAMKSMLLEKEEELSKELSRVRQMLSLYADANVPSQPVSNVPILEAKDMDLALAKFLPGQHFSCESLFEATREATGKNGLTFLQARKHIYLFCSKRTRQGKIQRLSPGQYCKSN